MKKKFLTVFTAAILMSLLLPILSYAGQWKSDEIGWWYEEKDGTYPVSQWAWIDADNNGTAECYCFDERGYCLMATTTPDHYMVNERGAWVVDGVVQTKEVAIQGLESVTFVDLSQFFSPDLKKREKIAEFCGMTPEELNRELNSNSSGLYGLTLLCRRDKQEQYPYYFDFKSVDGGGFATELTSIRPMHDGIHGFIKGLDANKKYRPSDLEVIVKQSGATIVSKTEEITQEEVWGLGSDGSMTANTGIYDNVYKNRLVFDYNGVRFTVRNLNRYSPYLNGIFAGPIE